MEAKMLQSPAVFQEVLDHMGLLDRLYDLMSKGDTGELVMEALAIMKKTGTIPPLVKKPKDKLLSNKYRNEGNDFYKGGQYQNALEFYNRALLKAPKGSSELVLAYSNRSALLFELKLYQACLNDIETCFSLECPINIVDKLKKRQNDANKLVWIENMQKKNRTNQFIDEFFQINGRRNPQIPCASADVGVIVKSRIPTVVALNEIKVGQILAVEKAFVGALDKKLVFTACHYCHKMSFNLHPCETCCYVLYCSEECRLVAQQEYHRIKCPIIEIFDHESSLPICSVAVKAAIKLKNQFGTWTELIEATSKLGLERMRESEINEIFDGNNKFSMLNMTHDRIFYYGHVYNSCLGHAVVLNYLGHLKSFFPVDSDDRASAMRAFARLLMHFTTNRSYTLTLSPMDVVVQNKTAFCGVGNFNILPFVGKLRNACEPNLLALGLNNQIALVAARPLQPGTELTVAYLGHWIDNNLSILKRRTNLLALYGSACDCPICTGDYESIGKTSKPTETQLRHLKKLNIKEMLRNYDMMKVDSIYPKCCQALATVADLPFSPEYCVAFTLFRKCLLELQECSTGNQILQDTAFED